MPVQEDSYKLWGADKWKSVGVTVNGKEFEKTFPSGIQAPHMDKPANGKGYCLDYMMHKWNKPKNVFPKSLKRVGTKPKKGDDTIYASDHFGLLAEINIK